MSGSQFWKLKGRGQRAREILVDDVSSVEAQVAQLRVRIRAVLGVAGVIVRGK